MSAVKWERGHQGRSIHAIHGAMGGRPRREVDLDRVRELLRAGLSIRETARQMGLGQGTARRALGLVPRSGKGQPGPQRRAKSQQEALHEPIGSASHPTPLS